MAEVKLTQKDMFTMIKSAFIEETDVDVDVDAIVAFCDTQIEKLENKAAAAKKLAEKKRAEGDALYDAVKEVITAEWQTRNKITDAIDMDEITPSKVGARLTKLVKEGYVIKEQQGSGKGRAMVYKLAETE